MIRPRWRLRVHHDGFWLLTPMWNVHWFRTASYLFDSSVASWDHRWSGWWGYLILERRAS